MSRNDNAQTPDEGTWDTTYAFPAHLLGELDAPAAEGVEPRFRPRKARRAARPSYS